MKKKLLFVVNVDWFFISHRLPIALGALEQGYEVHVATGVTDRLADLERHGLIVHPLAITRGRSSVCAEWNAFLDIYRVFRAARPDIVHLITIKPVLFGGIAARLAGVPAVVSAISGLGFVFVAFGVKAVLRRMLVGGLYRLALGKSKLRVIFQNGDDADCLTRLAGLPAFKRKIIRGSGADLTQFAFSEMPIGTPLVLMASRLITDKGVMEFVEAARLLRSAGIPVRFCLIGAIDRDNPASLTEDDLSAIKKKGIVEIWGQRNDMAAVMRSATLVVLPSYYGEGLPKVLIEAAASGRPVITTDMPGCRDAIDPDRSGILVPAKDSIALADAIKALLSAPHVMAAMGLAGRRLAEKEFDVRAVVASHLEIYRELVEK